MYSPLWKITVFGGRLFRGWAFISANMVVIVVETWIITKNLKVKVSSAVYLGSFFRREFSVKLVDRRAKSGATNTQTCTADQICQRWPIEKSPPPPHHKTRKELTKTPARVGRHISPKTPRLILQSHPGNLPQKSKGLMYPSIANSFRLVLPRSFSHSAAQKCAGVLSLFVSLLRRRVDFPAANV